MMSLALLVCMAALAVMMQSASSQDIPTVLIVGGSKDNNKATTLKCTNTKTNKTTCSSTCNKRCPHKCLIQCPSCKTFCCQYPIVAAIHFISLLHA
jgi:hypothetical protein